MLIKANTIFQDMQSLLAAVFSKYLGKGNKSWFSLWCLTHKQHLVAYETSQCTGSIEW